MRLLAIFAILSALLLAGCAMPGAGTGASQQGTPQQGAGGTPSEPAASQNQSGQQATPSQPTQPTQPTQPAGIPSEHVTFSSFSWVIHGTYYDSTATEPTRGIILLPMLDTGRDSYPPSLIGRMHGEIGNAPVLAMDLRGNGNTTNLGTWQSFQLEDYKAMQSDVVSAMTYMKLRHPTIKEFYLVGASMGSTAAITAAARSPSVIKVAMLSPGNYHDVDIGSATETYLHSMFIAASREDSESADAASDIYERSPTTHKTLKIYEGIAHGTDMFEATKYDDESLESLLMVFLKG